jgi:hypothetical protein
MWIETNCTKFSTFIVKGKYQTLGQDIKVYFKGSGFWVQRLKSEYRTAE